MRRERILERTRGLPVVAICRRMTHHPAARNGSARWRRLGNDTRAVFTGAHCIGGSSSILKVPAQSGRTGERRRASPEASTGGIGKEEP